MQPSENHNQTLIQLQNGQNSIHSVIQNSQHLSEPQNNNQQNQQTHSRIRTCSKIKKTIKIKAQRAQKTEQNIIKQCRICLQGQQQGRMVQPCLCSGSITYAHEKCLIEWIKRKHETKTKKLFCQMCHTPFTYKFGKRRKLNIQQYCINYQKQKCNFIIFYIFVFLLLLVIIGLIVIISESGQDTEIGIQIKNLMMKSDNIKVIYICVVFILAIVLMFLLILFMVQYAVKTEVLITEVMDYCGVGINRKTRIHPRINQPARQNIQTVQQ